jgi:hypothetical protein
MRLKAFVFLFHGAPLQMPPPRSSSSRLAGMRGALGLWRRVSVAIALRGGVGQIRDKPTRLTLPESWLVLAAQPTRTARCGLDAVGLIATAKVRRHVLAGRQPPLAKVRRFGCSERT